MRGHDRIERAVPDRLCHSTGIQRRYHHCRELDHVRSGSLDTWDYVKVVLGRLGGVSPTNKSVS
jgi:hypothetical protein